MSRSVAALGQPVGEGPEGLVDELVERYRAAGAGPEREAGADHAGRGGGQQPRIGVALGIGAEPLGEPLGDGALDHRHVRGVGGPQVRVGAGDLHPAQPVRRIAAELAELIGDRPGVLTRTMRSASSAGSPGAV